MLAILAPGQGAQRQGFLAPWLSLPAPAEHLARLSDAAGIDLVAAGTTMSDAEITDTAIAQPLIVAASLMSAAVLPDLPRAAVFAGHSVGEFAASALAGIISDTDAMRLVATRGAAMAQASADPAGGMTAILGGDPAEVTRRIDAAGCVRRQLQRQGSGRRRRHARGARPPRRLHRPPALGFAHSPSPAPSTPT